MNESGGEGVTFSRDGFGQLKWNEIVIYTKIQSRK